MVMVGGCVSSAAFSCGDQPSRRFLNHNSLSGGIPDAFQQLSGLTNLDMSGNNLTDRLPPSMASLSSLKTLFGRGSGGGMKHEHELVELEDMDGMELEHELVKPEDMDGMELEHGLVEPEDTDDDIESLSSFSDIQLETSLISSDDEVESLPYGDIMESLMFDRKRKLTDHWKRFISPLTWRCRWVELQIKKYEFQAQIYDEELAKLDQRKQLEFEKFSSEGYDAKSQPFISQVGRNEVMMRRKRKQFEETTDVASYMSNHNLFSYGFGKTVCDDTLPTDVKCVKLDRDPVKGNGEIGFDDEYLLVESSGNNNDVVQILLNIEVAQSKARSLKKRIDEVVSKNPGKFSSLEQFRWVAPYAGLTTGSDQTHVSPKPVIASTSAEHLPEETMENLLIPEFDFPGFGDFSFLPDMLIDPNECEETDKEQYENFERMLRQLTDDVPTSPILEEEEMPSAITSAKVTNKKKKKRVP